MGEKPIQKNFGNETVVTPLPVLIIATYNEKNCIPNATNIAWNLQSDYHKVAFHRLSLFAKYSSIPFRKVSSFIFFL